MTHTNPFPKVSAFLPSLPLGLIKRLRQVVEAGSPADTFACYCNLVEWLANYLANLCNSAYKECPADLVDERLESVLRGLSHPLSFGTTVNGLQALGRGNYGLEGKLPELAAVVGANRLPPSCVRQIKAFRVIKRAREDFSIPPTHLRKYVRAQIPDDDQGTRGSLDDYLRTLIEFRNKGVGHQDEEGWFPRDRHMYALLNELITPAVDDLLEWEPMQGLLTRYEIVSVERAETWPIGQLRACAIVRRQVADGYAPLGPSHLILTPALRPEAGADVIARRDVIPHELQAVARYTAFPQTHQSSEQLHRRYAAIYLRAYLERGLVTPAQRENELNPAIRRLGIADNDRARIEGEINTAINNAYSPDAGGRFDGPLQALASLVGPEWPALQGQIVALLEQLPGRRRDAIFEQIDNNTIMSFDQLRRETELSEYELTSVLDDLEQDGRVRQVGASPTDRAHAHFKAQDPQKPATFRELLSDLRVQANPRRRYPAALWRLVELCSGLLADDGLPVPESELAALRPLVEAGPAAPTEPAALGAITLLLDGDEIRAESVRDLYEHAIAWLRRREIDPTPVVPFLIGRTRYLVHHTPVHANGTPFAVPVAVDGLYFEANRNREQALAEVLRFLRRLGVEATSPDLPGTESVHDEEDLDLDSDEDAASRLGIEIRGADDEPPVPIKGPTVRRFFTALLDHLIGRSADLDRILPVKAGRIRHLLNDEPYHANGSPFDARSTIERDGYFMNTAFSYDQALLQARTLCEQLGLQARALDGSLIEASETTAPLRVDIGGETIEAEDAPTFLGAAIEALYNQGILTEADIPYKAGRVRYLIAEVPTHDHGRAFIRPIEVYLGERRYFVEANISRSGAVDVIQRLLASKQPPQRPTPAAAPADV